MHRFTLLLFTTLTLATTTARAEENPLWLRHSTIAPDGKTIAFGYKGDIYTVSTAGGQARQITSNAAFDGYPVWSPDGKHIAFSSDREGSLDVYIVSRYGGTPVRLTTNSGAETPVMFTDNGHVVFEAQGMPSTESIIFTSRSFPQLYSVATKPGMRPVLFSELTMKDPSMNAAGDLLFHDQKGYEDPWRKHHTSPITRDIWLRRNGRYTRLTTFGGEDRNAVWGQGDTYYYLSEEDGTFNVYRRNIDGSGKTQLTHFKGNPVRFLSRSQNGTLCFGYNGELYTMTEGQEPQRIAVTITADPGEKTLDRQTITSGATEISVSPNGKEIAFVLHGDVYVTAIDYSTTKQITDTPEQERSIDFSPDGRSIVYASERGGRWQIYQSTIKDKKEDLFTYCTDITEEQLVKSDRTSFQPQYSPDGKMVAFLEDRTTLKVIDLKSHETRTLMEGKYAYSYSDGDQWFDWSPDSRWLICNYIGTGGWNNADIALVSADGKTPIRNLTNSGYNDGNGRFVLGGKAMLFQSDRAGFRSHGSWGAEDDAYLMFFDLEAYERFRMNKEEYARWKDTSDKAKKEEEEKKKADEKAAKDKKDNKPIKPEKVEPLQLDVDNCRDRVLRLTVNSSHMGDCLLNPDGTVLYYQSRFEGGQDLWKHDIREQKTQLVMKGVDGGMEADKDFKDIYVCRGGIRKIDVASAKITPVTFEARFNYRPYEERTYMFDHIWQQVKDKFYDPQLHGVDWAAYRDNYRRFLPYINNGYDYSEMLSEMLGELNGSHTGARFYPDGARLQTAALGLFFDERYDGDGLKIKEVLDQGPFAQRDTKVKAGDIITAIDGDTILAGRDYNYMLDGKADKLVTITLRSGSKSRLVNIRPITVSQQDDLLYRRWVRHNRHVVDSLSHGQLAYVHVRAMDSESFRTVFCELLADSSRQKKAAIIDERHNGGGWLHDDLCTLLSGKQYQSFTPRGQYIGWDPWNKWVKPTCVMVCEDDYSNGHGFPFVYKTLGIGKLIGTPVAGTMTAVWWETLLNRQFVFGIPQVGCMDMTGKYGENNTLQPDIEVYNSPEDFLTGNDEQLKRAVEEMLKE